MRNLLTICVVAAVCGAAGCGPALDAPGEAALAGAPAVSARAQMSSVRIPYSLPGVPGPWWRDNALREDFQDDQRSCRDASAAAREAATGGDRKDVAYRAFLECMAKRAWTRGYPPRDGAGA